MEMGEALDLVDGCYAVPEDDAEAKKREADAKAAEAAKADDDGDDDEGEEVAAKDEL